MTFKKKWKKRNILNKQFNAYHQNEDTNKPFE